MSTWLALLGEAIATARKSPDAKTVIPYTKGERVGLVKGMTLLVSAAMQQTSEVRDAQKALENRLQQIEGRVRQERKIMRVVRDERGEIVASVTELDLSGEQGALTTRGDDGLTGRVVETGLSEKLAQAQLQLVSVERRLSRHAEHLARIESKLQAKGK